MQGGSGVHVGNYRRYCREASLPGPAAAKVCKESSQANSPFLLLEAPPLAFVRRVYVLLSRALARPLTVSRESRRNLQEARAFQSQLLRFPTELGCSRRCCFCSSACCQTRRDLKRSSNSGSERRATQALDVAMGFQQPDLQEEVLIAAQQCLLVLTSSRDVRPVQDAADLTRLVSSLMAAEMAEAPWQNGTSTSRVWVSYEFL